MKSITARFMGTVACLLLALSLVGCGGEEHPTTPTPKPAPIPAAQESNATPTPAPAPVVTPTTAPAPAPTVTPATAPSTKKLVIRVDAGSDKPYTDSAGNVWEADNGFQGGDIVDRGDIKITGTDKAPLYKTEHWGMESWSREVPNGKYTVRLHFAETWPDAQQVGGRIFTVKVGDNAQELTELDVFKESGGPYKALVKELTGVEVTKGKLTITFIPSTEATAINGIEVIQE